MLILVGTALHNPTADFGFLQINDAELSEVSQLANIPLFEFNQRDYFKEYTLELFNQYLCDGYGRVLERLKDPALIAEDRKELVKVLANISLVMEALEPYSERENPESEILILRDNLVSQVYLARAEEKRKA